MEERKWTVYVHIVPKEISGYDHDKYYVGITSQTTYARWQREGYGYKSQLFFRAIKKYKWDNICHEIIAEHLTKDEAQHFESFLISKLNSNNKEYGYNLSSGGEGHSGVQSYKRIDLTGKRFTKLTVLKLYEKKYYSKACRGALQWVCRCDCGNTIIVNGSNLKNGNTKSCGCLNKERKITPNKIIEHSDYISLFTSKMEEIKVDKLDYEKIKSYRWYLYHNIPVSESRKTSKRLLFNLKNMIFDIKHANNKKLKISHTNGDVLDFRKQNITINIPDGCSYEEYMMFAQTKMTGISWNAEKRQWCLYKYKPNKYFDSMQELLDYVNMEKEEENYELQVS